MVAALSDLLFAAQADGRGVAAFNVFGIDEAVRIVAAAESVAQPVILMTNRDLVAQIPVEVLGRALRALAERAAVPVGIHLDHTFAYETIYRALAAGYTSVMYDGSQLPFEENVARTRHVVEIAHACDVSVEGEIGSVAYNDTASTIRDERTDPELAAELCSRTGVDAVAVSVGTVHKLTEERATIDHDLLARIAELTRTPLVIHGSSGVPDHDLQRMARGPVAKFNIGTRLRRVWGETLRSQLAAQPDGFDRLKLTDAPLAALQQRAQEIIALLAQPATPHHAKETSQ